MSAADAEIGIRLVICLAMLVFLSASSVYAALYIVSCCACSCSFFVDLEVSIRVGQLWLQRVYFTLGSFGFEGLTSCWAALSLKGLRHVGQLYL